jgi:uncharacterized protein
MTRLLFWIGLVILIVMAVRSKLRAVLNANDMAGPGTPAAAPSAAPGRVEDATERMACCAACGLHFPASEAVTAGGREYCSTAHAHAHSHPAP